MRFGMLGTLQVDSSLSALSVAAPKQRVILAALLLRAGQIVSVDELADAIWAEAVPSGARKVVQSYVMRLRQVLGAEAGARISSRPPGYMIQVQQGELDLRVLAGDVRAAQVAASAGDWGVSQRHAEHALSLLRGQPLEDIPSVLLHRNYVPHFNELVLAAHEALIDAECYLGNQASAATRLSELVATNPAREGLYLRLMNALDSLGRRGDALAVYAEARRALVSELGIEPGHDLRMAHQRILQGHRGHDRSTGAGPAADPGPAAGRSASKPRQLPRDIADFAGRAAEVLRLQDILTPAVQPDQAGRSLPVAVISGPGGIGKTTLAVHVAHRLHGHFPDGQVFLQLRGMSPAPLTMDDILRRLLQALAIEDRDIPAGSEERAVLFRSRSHGRRILFVFDDADKAAQIQDALPAASGSAVLITSRARLRSLPGAHHVELDGLDITDSRSLFERIAGEWPPGQDRSAIDAVLQLCGGLPLAVRITGAQLAAESVSSASTLARLLADERGRLDALAIEDLSVRSSLGVGYDSLRLRPTGGLLTASLRRLSLIDGPSISLEAAAVLLGRGVAETRFILADLVDASLLENTDQDHYELHDLVRLSARERAEAEDTAPARAQSVRALLGWYLRSASNAARAVSPARRHADIDFVAAVGDPCEFADYDEAFAWLDAELPNLMAAVHQAEADGEHDIGWRLATTLYDIFVLRENWPEWIRTYEAGLRSALQAGDRLGEAWILNSLSTVYARVGRIADSMECLARSLEIVRDAGDRMAEVVILGNMGNAHQELGQLDEALVLYERALATCGPGAEPHRVGRLLLNIGEVRQLLGQHEVAMEYYARVLDSEDRHLAGIALSGLGAAHASLGRHESAVENYRNALQRHRSAGSRPHEGRTLAHLADALSALGRDDEAAQSRFEAMLISGELRMLP